MQSNSMKKAVGKSTQVISNKQTLYEQTHEKSIKLQWNIYYKLKLYFTIQYISPMILNFY